jgi:DNA-binding IclR family transcriptional regulator
LTVSPWPKEAQDDAAMALADIEETVRVLRSLTPEQHAKLEALRETINRSIEEGGSYTDEEVEAGIAANLDARETKRITFR